MKRQQMKRFRGEIPGTVLHKVKIIPLKKPVICAIMCITDITKDGEKMILKIDFNSDEAIYIQLRNQIIIGIARSSIREGDSLPSVRQMADNIGVNMHTVNKAYSVLKQEGFVKLDRRKGAVVSLDVDKIQVLDEMRKDLSVVLARGVCKNVSCQEVHQLVDEIFQSFLKGQREE